MGRIASIKNIVIIAVNRADQTANSNIRLQAWLPSRHNNNNNNNNVIIIIIMKIVTVIHRIDIVHNFQ
jgi:hypothetical protein